MVKKITSWSNKLRTTLALSSTKGEYKVLYEAAKNITYICRLYQELGLS
uniref:Uncharacterized protein n=1 Tax=Physcomitrium patens TaxID=3218 RepID=A0A7I3ZFF5_PHYPA